MIATFHSARCRKGGKGAKDFVAHGHSSNGTYSLYVSIDQFSGFHHYELGLDRNADPFVIFSNAHSDSAPAYSNIFVPPFPSPGGGGIDFAGHGRLMGVGFSPAYSRDFSDAVTFTGVLTCRYKRKKRRSDLPQSASTRRYQTFP